MLPPYMIQLCQRVFNMDYNHFDADDESTAVLIGVCSNWFYQAYEHCSALLTRKPGCQKIWNKIMTLKRFIFPENETAILSHEIPISIHPDLLSPSNCQELANQIIKDYIHYIPRYMAVLNENQCLWLILRGILGVAIVATCVYFVAKRYNTFRHNRPEIDVFNEPLSMHQRMLNRNVKRVLYETRYLSVVPVLDPSLLKCGCPALGLKIDARKFCDVQAILVKPVKRENPSDADNYQTQAGEKLQNFFNHSGKYRLVISLDLDKGDDETGLKVSKSGTVKSSSGIPIHKPTQRIGIRRRL